MKVKIKDPLYLNKLCALQKAYSEVVGSYDQRGLTRDQTISFFDSLKRSGYTLSVHNKENIPVTMHPADALTVIETFVQLLEKEDIRLPIKRKTIDEAMLSLEFCLITTGYNSNINKK